MKIRYLKLGNSVKVGDRLENPWFETARHDVDMTLEDKLFIRIKDRRTDAETLTTVMNMVYCVPLTEVKDDAGPKTRRVVKLRSESTPA